MKNKLNRAVVSIKLAYVLIRFRSVASIADDAWRHLSDADKQAVREAAAPHDMVKFHFTIGVWIRNYYGLWHPYNRLTRRFFTDRDEYVSDGVDYHPCHPDAISTRVLYELWSISQSQ